MQPLAGSLRSEWVPLLANTLRDKAVSAIQDIAADLRSIPSDSIQDPSLFSGHAGIALFFAHLGESPLGDTVDQKHAILHLKSATSGLRTVPMDPSFGSGLAGVMWTLAHLKKLSGGKLRKRGFSSIDRTIADIIDDGFWSQLVGLWEGQVGIAVYLMERLPDPQSRARLRRLVLNLRKIATATELGVFWQMPLGLYADHHETESQASESEVNLGVAHGVPGVIAALSRLCLARIEARTTRELLEGAVEWLLAQRLPEDHRFPYAVCPGRQPSPARVAWCYGEPGIAIALYSAAQALRDRQLARLALKIADLAAKRPDHESGIEDACICHGAAGVAHILNRLFQATRSRDIESDARSWFERTLEMRLPGEGIGGFFGVGRLEGTDVTHHLCPDLMNGAAGIGLALLSAATSMPPTWDRCLLTDIRPGR